MPILSIFTFFATVYLGNPGINEDGNSINPFYYYVELWESNISNDDELVAVSSEDMKRGHPLARMVY